MNIKELIEVYEHHFNSGLGCPTVKFKLKIEDWDTYLDEGMLADVHSVKHMADGETVVVNFNIMDYKEYNNKVEKPTYYDSHGEPCLTATEANLNPQRYVNVYFYINDGADVCEITEEPPTRVLLTKEQKDFLIHAAKMERSVYQMRAEEASTGNLADSSTVDEALRQLVLANNTITLLKNS